MSTIPIEFLSQEQFLQRVVVVVHRVGELKLGLVRPEGEDFAGRIRRRGERGGVLHLSDAAAVVRSHYPRGQRGTRIPDGGGGG